MDNYFIGVQSLSAQCIYFDSTATANWVELDGALWVCFNI